MSVSNKAEPVVREAGKQVTAAILMLTSHHNQHKMFHLDWFCPAMFLKVNSAQVQENWTANELTSGG